MRTLTPSRDEATCPVVSVEAMWGAVMKPPSPSQPGGISRGGGGGLNFSLFSAVRRGPSPNPDVYRGPGENPDFHPTWDEGSPVLGLPVERPSPVPSQGLT